MTQLPVHSHIADEFAKNQNFTGVSFVAKGAFKETYQAVTDNNQTVALKIFDPSKCDIARNDREINAIKKCDSPYIGKLFDYGNFKAADGNTYFFALEEFFDGGTLSSQIQNAILPPSLVREYAIALINALDHLKAMKLVHRDIKPDNIMFRKGIPTPILVDFGLVRDLSESSLTQTWLPRGPGTAYYSAPEQLNNDKDLIKWRTDQFCLGVVLSFCLIGQHPFQEPGMTIPETVNAVAQRLSYAPTFRQKVRSLGFDCLIKMVEAWPVRRYSTPQEILNDLPKV
jgi:serine/threonine protein kinase